MIIKNYYLHCQKGFSLFELFLAILLGSLLMTSIALIYDGGLKSWNTGYKRYKMKRNLSLTLERMSQDLREARRVDRYNNKADSIEFDILEQGTVKTYVYYLYAADDPWPNPPWMSSYYQLRKLDLAGGFVYGRGVLLLEDIESPRTPLTSWIMKVQEGSSEVILDFAISSDYETFHMRTQVRPRNVP